VSFGVTVGARYRHYKGGDYLVVACGKHSETGEAMVAYKTPTANDYTVWFRPAKMFNEEIVPGIKRFTRVPHE
jgi:hypothetical protein